MATSIDHPNLELHVSRLADRAAGTLGNLPPKAVGLLTTTGFAAAGVVAVIAENLRTLADRDQALPERAKKVSQNSLGVVLGGPSALTDRGRSLVGKGDGDRAGGNGSGDGHSGAPARPTPSGGTATSAQAAPDDEAVPPRAIDTSSAEAAPSTSKPASRQQRDTAGAGQDEAAARKEQAEEAARKAAEQADRAADAAQETARKATDTTKSVADRAADTAGGTARSAADTAKSVADRTRDRVEEAAELTRTTPTGTEATGTETTSAKKASTKKTSTKKASTKKASTKKASTKKASTKKASTEKASAAKGADEGQGPDVPAGVDEGLVADLQRMTVSQLRERAAQDGVAGRSSMSKDELVAALAVRETDDAPAKG